MTVVIFQSPMVCDSDRFERYGLMNSRWITCALLMRKRVSCLTLVIHHNVDRSLPMKARMVREVGMNKNSVFEKNMLCFFLLTE